MGFTPYEQAIVSAEKIGVMVFQESPKARFPAKALRIGDTMGVFIDESAFDTDVERRFALEHEIAHCETESFYNEAMPFIDCRKMDYRAKRRTVEKLVPFGCYVETIINGYIEEWEQAEKWNIPEWFVSIVHNIYASTRWDEVQRLKVIVQSDYC